MSNVIVENVFFIASDAQIKDKREMNSGDEQDLCENILQLEK